MRTFEAELSQKTRRFRGIHVAMSPAMTNALALEQKLRSRTARTGVVGLGYVGLPLAVELAECGFSTTGIDLDSRKTSAIEAGRSCIPDVPDVRVAALRSAG